MMICDAQHLPTNVTAADALQTCGPAAKVAVAALAKLAADTQPWVRAHAIKAIMAVDAHGDQTLRVATTALADKERSVQAAAVRALGQLGAKAKPAVGAILARLTAEDFRAQPEAIEALPAIDPKSRQAIVHIRRIVQDHQAAYTARYAAAKVLGNFDHTTEGALAVVNGMKSPPRQSYMAAKYNRKPSFGSVALASLAQIAKRNAEGAPQVAAGIELDWFGSDVRSIAEDLPALAKANPDLVKALIAACVDENEKPRRGVIYALAHTQRLEATAALEELALKGTTEVRQQALAAIAALGPRTPGVLATLRRALQAQQASIRQAALQALASFDPKTPGVPEIAKQMTGDPDPLTRTRAACLLVGCERDVDSAVAVLAKSLQHQPARRVALYGLEAAAERARTAVPAVLEILNSTSKYDTGPVLRVLGKIGGDDDRVIRTLALVMAVPSPRTHTRSLAIDLLCHMGPKATPTLVTALKSADRGLRAEVAAAVIEQAPNRRPAAGLAVAVLTEQLDQDLLSAYKLALRNGQPGLTYDSNRWRHRRKCAEALEKIDAARVTIDRLVRELTDKDPDVRRVAARCLRLFPASVEPALAPLIRVLLEDSQADIRCESAVAIGEFGSEAGPAVPALLSAARNDLSVKVRKAALRGLGGIGPPAAAAVSPLLAIVADLNHPLWDDAVAALGGIGPAAEPAVPHLVETMSKYLADDNDLKARRIENALKGIQGDAQDNWILR